MTKRKRQRRRGPEGWIRPCPEYTADQKEAILGALGAPAWSSVERAVESALTLQEPTNQEGFADELKSLGATCDRLLKEMGDLPEPLIEELGTEDRAGHTFVQEARESVFRLWKQTLRPRPRGRPRAEPLLLGLLIELWKDVRGEVPKPWTSRETGERTGDFVRFARAVAEPLSIDITDHQIRTLLEK